MASITGLTSQVGRLQHYLDTLKGQATLPACDRQGPAAPFTALSDENNTVVTPSQARQAAIDDDAIHGRLAPVASGNLLRDGQGIADVRSEMLADYALGRDDLTSSDILQRWVAIDRCESGNPRDPPRILQECQSGQQTYPHQPH